MPASNRAVAITNRRLTFMPLVYLVKRSLSMSCLGRPKLRENKKTQVKCRVRNYQWPQPAGVAKHGRKHHSVNKDRNQGSPTVIKVGNREHNRAYADRRIFRKSNVHHSRA